MTGPANSGLISVTILPESIMASVSCRPILTGTLEAAAPSWAQHMVRKWHGCLDESEVLAVGTSSSLPRQSRGQMSLSSTCEASKCHRTLQRPLILSVPWDFRGLTGTASGYFLGGSRSCLGFQGRVLFTSGFIRLTVTWWFSRSAIKASTFWGPCWACRHASHTSINHYSL